MTLGKKLALQRKAIGLTQDEVALRIRVNTKTLADWENNIGEPSIQNLKDFATLFNISLDDLLDTGLGDDDETLAHCKVCGVVITEKNLGDKSPEMLCRRCVEVRKAHERRAELERKAIEERKKKIVLAQKMDEYNAHLSRQRTIRKKRNKSFLVASLVTAPLVAFLVYSLNQSFDMTWLIAGSLLCYALFSEISLLFYDGIVRNFIVRMRNASFKMPGLMYTFDWDGFLWVIMMKGLFALLKWVLSGIFGFIGFLICLFIAPVVFPYKMIKMIIDIHHGDVADYV
jgi:transcriptional regulator with XRE-family HTH domain